MDSSPPNIVLLFTDQQRYDTIAACGYPWMHTPNLDRLVREGCHFPQAYTPNPVCIPARHNIITGLTARYHGYANNAGKPLDATLPVLPRILSDAGYDTHAVGKMHFRPPRRHNGFHKMELMEEIPRHREDDEYAMYLREHGFGNVQNIHGVRNLLYMLPQRALIPEEHHGSTWVGSRAVEYLRTNGGKRPFFLWASWIAPHPPFDVPAPFSNLYNGSDLPAPLHSETPLSDSAAVSGMYADLPETKVPQLVRRMREVYAGAVSLVDKNVGRILNALEEIGQLDNTLIIYTSDHGEMLGDYGCFQKMLPYDSASRIPFIVRYPQRVEPGTIRREFVDLNDILPTILDVAGLEYPGELELPGGSLFADTKDRTVQYVEYGSDRTRWISLRDKRYKYVYYYGGGHEELFDLTDDPGEGINVLHTQADKREVQAARAALRAMLCKYEEKWGLQGYVTDGTFAPFERRPRHRGRNRQFPLFPNAIVDEAERREMNNFGDEVIQAVKDEELVKLHELDLQSWSEAGVDPDLIERIRSAEL